MSDDLQYAREEAGRARRWIKDYGVTPSPEDAELLRRVSRPKSDVTYEQICGVHVRLMRAHAELPQTRAKWEAEAEFERERVAWAEEAKTRGESIVTVTITD